MHTFMRWKLIYTLKQWTRSLFSHYLIAFSVFKWTEQLKLWLQKWVLKIKHDYFYLCIKITCFWALMRIKLYIYKTNYTADTFYEKKSCYILRVRQIWRNDRIFYYHEAIILSQNRTGSSTWPQTVPLVRTVTWW